MKKFTKILAVLMTVCLLFGVVAAFGTSAKVASTNGYQKLYVKYSSAASGNFLSHNFLSTFDHGWAPYTPSTVTATDKNDSTKTSTFIDQLATVSALNNHRFKVGNSTAGSNYPAVLVIEEKDDGEGWLAIRRDASGILAKDANLTKNAPSMTFSIEYFLGLGHIYRGKTYTSTSRSLAAVEFAVSDFDFGTDRWAYQIKEGDKLVWKTSEVLPDGAINARPAYAETDYQFIIDRFNGTTQNNDKAYYNADISFYIREDAVTGRFFATKTANDNEFTVGEDVMLSNQPGVLDHASFVCDSRRGVADVDVHIYINGQYLYTFNHKSGDYEDTYDNLYIHSAYITFFGGVVDDGGTPDDSADDILEKDIDNYSLAYDNIVTNYYQSAFAYNATSGLKAFFDGSDNYKTKSLGTCVDTIYGIYEQRDDAVVVVDDTKYKVLGTDLGSTIITDGADVKLTAGKAFTASPAADVESFNVTLGDGSTLATKTGAYKAVESDGTYALTKIETKANVSLFTDMAFNLYVPADAGFTADGFVDTTIGGVAYKQYTWNPELGSFDSASVTLNYGEVSSVIELDVVKYATLVADAFDCNTAQAKLAYEIMDYKAAVAKYLDPDFDAANVAALNAFYALYEEHADGCTCGAEAEIDANAINKGILEGKTISFLLESGKFSIVLGGFTAGESVSVVIGEGKDAYTATLTADAEGDVVFNNVNAALLRFTFNVTVGGEAGQYRLSAYIAALSDGADKNLAVAMYEYSVAVYNFKTAPIN